VAAPILRGGSGRDSGGGYGCHGEEAIGALGEKTGGGGRFQGMKAPGLTGIDHVAIAVRDLDAAIEWYSDVLGATVTHREVVEADGVEEALLAVSDSFIQLLTPTRPDSPVARSLDQRGEGLHHVGYRVTDCEVALHAAVEAGARAIDAAPRPGSRGTTVAFLHPKTAFGTLVELVQA
jgi:methylmalonyl-CoA/ethylmalonyl-CoA epimerase